MTYTKATVSEGGGSKGWYRGRWWYKPAHVCQRWRNVVLGSAAYLDVSLVCSNGTPVADMLAHSPPLPLVIDYGSIENYYLTAEDEEGAVLALKQYDRVRRVRLFIPPTSLQKFITTMDDQYPILEHLIITHPGADRTTILTFPETLQASSTASTPPHADRLRPSNRISIAYDCCGPRHTLSCHG